MKWYLTQSVAAYWLHPEPKLNTGEIRLKEFDSWEDAKANVPFGVFVTIGGVGVPQLVERVLDRWKFEGFDTIGHGDGHGWYPCLERDIPSGAIGVYYSIDSEEAQGVIEDGIVHGWTY
jgi:hypothetical protein